MSVMFSTRYYIGAAECEGCKRENATFEALVIQLDADLFGATFRCSHCGHKEEETLNLTEFLKEFDGPAHTLFQN